MGVVELGTFDGLARAGTTITCQLLPAICYFLGGITGADNPLVTTPEIEANFLSHIPATTSTKTMQHLAQNRETATFRAFDYGSTLNLQNYGTDTPPIYDITQIANIPIAMLNGGVDLFGDLVDARTVADQINNVLVFFGVYPDMGHFSFFTANNAEGT